tara:strand:- start:125 stop:1012 length:888 start_codon:yes stop_codon:yes gene_type:complete
MATNLTGTTVASTYSQLLHLDGGPAAAEKTVLSAVGVSTALKLGTGSASVDNLKLDGNTVSSTDTNGNITLAPNGTGSVVMAKVAITGGSVSGITDLAVADGGTGASDASTARTNLGLGSMATQAANSVAITGGTAAGITQLDVDNVRVDGNTISSTNSNGSITLDPNGTGEIIAKAKVGYSSGDGGTVTQASSRTTGVTLNKLSGQITLVSAQITAHEANEFVLTNSFIAATDVVIVNLSGSSASDKKFYTVNITNVSAGACTISVGNNDNASIPAAGAEAPVLSFMVLKASNA